MIASIIAVLAWVIILVLVGTGFFEGFVIFILVRTGLLTGFVAFILAGMELLVCFVLLLLAVAGIFCRGIDEGS